MRRALEAEIPQISSPDEVLSEQGLGPSPSDLRTVLEHAARLLSGLEQGFEGHARGMADLLERLDAGRFHLAVLGQFKRGKSTLLNALLGEPLLPASVVPLTAIPTFIGSGESTRARVLFLADDAAPEVFRGPAAGLPAFLARFVTEEANPKNRLGVSHVEVFHPAPILRKGVLLIDTPGIGSTFRHNTEATLNFLPQCDAAVFLVSADPPVTEVEVAFLKQVRSKVSRLFFILNKVDYLSDSERRTALEFFKRALREDIGLGEDVPVFCVSARRGLEAKQASDAALWAESGMAEVEAHLVEFLASEKTRALREALSRKAADVVSDALMRLRLEVRSLRMPLDELRDRLGAFERRLADVERERVAARDLLSGDQRRMHEALEEHADALRKKARGYLEGIVRETAAKVDPLEIDEREVGQALAEAIPGFFEHQTGETTAQFETRTAEALRPHQKRADDLIESIRRAASELFRVPYHAPESSGAFALARDPYWVTHRWNASPILIPPSLLDRFLPARTRRQRIRRRVMGQVAELVIPNVENLRWAIYQSIDRTFLRFGRTLDERLADTISATHGAIRAAMARRKERAEATADEMARLEAAADVLTDIQGALGRA
ncbi:MAG: dynamin family protein [Planctomycetes bacterium]|nr:dynamin family protein [Planctomycetota bacterium]